MNLTVDELIAIIGRKDVELYVLQRELAAARVALAPTPPAPDAEKA